MRAIKLVLILPIMTIFIGCTTITPELASKYGQNLPALELCKRYFYTASLGGTSNLAISKAYGDVAVSRGINCDSYIGAIQQEQAINAANNAAIFGAYMGALGAASNAQPTYVVPQQSSPSQCRVIRGAYGDRIYCN